MGYTKAQNVQKMMGHGPRAGRGQSFSVTSWFFDSPKVMNAVDAAGRKVLSRFGSFVRRTMRGSIRKRKRAAKPGQAPSSRTGLLKKFIYFSFDPRTRGVVIGPERLNAKVGDTPHVLEYGGSHTIATYRKKNGKRTVTCRRVTLKPHPYARPALAKELPKLPGMWAGSIKT